MSGDSRSYARCAAKLTWWTCQIDHTSGGLIAWIVVELR
jgi:hypothetical protein